MSSCLSWSIHQDVVVLCFGQTAGHIPTCPSCRALRHLTELGRRESKATVYLEPAGKYKAEDGVNRTEILSMGFGIRVQVLGAVWSWAGYVTSLNPES